MKYNGKWGLIDKSGKFVIEPKFDRIGYYWDGLAEVKVNDKYGFIDKDGKLVIEPKFESVCGFHDGLAKVKYNGKWGLIDKSGKFVIEPKFDTLLGFDDELANEEINDKESKIDTTENIVGEHDCFMEISNSDYEDFTEEKFEEAKSSGNIIVVMKKSEAKNVEELHEEIYEGDVAAVVTRIGDDFTYLGDYGDDKEVFEDKEINFDELYIIYDDNNELEETSLMTSQSELICLSRRTPIILEMIILWMIMTPASYG